MPDPRIVLSLAETGLIDPDGADGRDENAEAGADHRPWPAPPGVQANPNRGLKYPYFGL